MLVDVIEAHYCADYRIFIKFEDGLAGEVDLRPRLKFTGIFAPLRDKKLFALVAVNPDLGTICWPNGADVAPETLYALLKGN